MTGISVAPDSEYLITEERLRFPVEAAVPPNMVPVVVAQDLTKAIDKLQRLRGWHLLERVPARTAFAPNGACCAAMRQPPGSGLSIRFEPSPFQGDTDDATNFDEASDPDKRLQEENTIDWVAIVHFWEPAIFMMNDFVREQSLALDEAEGFMRWDQMPDNAWPVLKKRFAR